MSLVRIVTHTPMFFATVIAKVVILVITIFIIVVVNVIIVILVIIVVVNVIKGQNAWQGCRSPREREWCPFRGGAGMTDPEDLI